MTTDDIAHEPQLIDEAIELLMRHRADPDGEVSAAVIDAWRMRSAGHDRIWLKLAMIDGAAAHVLKAERGKRSRRQVLAGAGATLALGLVGAVTLPGMLLYARADHTTDKAQIVPFTLPDGSTAILGPQSAIAVDMDGAGRSVELLAGMAYVTVASGQSPLEVRAGGLRATCSPGSFDIAMGNTIEFCVAEGQAELRGGDTGQVPTALSGGDYVAYDQRAQSLRRGRRDAQGIAAWRDNRLVVEDEALSDLVARMSRWTSGQVVIADPFIGSQRISGVFDLDDPLRALRAAVHPAGGQVRQFSEMLTIISSV